MGAVHADTAYTGQERMDEQHEITRKEEFKLGESENYKD